MASRAAWKGTWGGLWFRYTGTWFHVQVRIGRVRWAPDTPPPDPEWKRRLRVMGKVSGGE